MQTSAPRAIDQEKLGQFINKAVLDSGAAMHAALIVVGDKLGLYKAMADGEPVTPQQLADKTSTAERYVREWLNANAASGYVAYDPESRTYSLTPEQAFALAVEDSPAFVPGLFQCINACVRDTPKVIEAFRTGKGIGWHERDADLFQGTERFFRPNYAANLISSWIPSLQGVADKLDAGGSVADVGCGHGASTLLMAKAFPNAHLTGFDYHRPSIEWAENAAREAHVADRVKFEVASSKEYPVGNYSLVTFFDCLHDMGDPVGAAKHVRESLADDGTWMIVEPFANDDVKDNLNPVGRVFYSVSTFVCTPASPSQEVGLALGAQAGEARLRQVAMAGGFTRFRRAAETPFNLIFEATP